MTTPFPPHAEARVSTFSFSRLHRAARIGLTAAAGMILQSADAGAERPNLVFVFSDQQSSDMLGSYGNKDVRTPNLDKLAEEGIRFNHCVSNSPVCTPYRGILFSGQHPLYNGAMQNDLRMLPGHGNYFAEVLRDAGYRTGYFGKWHLYGGERVRGIPAGPYRYGFDDEFLTNNCTLVYSKERSYYWSQDGKDRLLYGDWESDEQTRQAIRFIEKDPSAPFALFLSWHPPHNWGRAHAGYAAPQDLLDLYDPASITLRPTVTDSETVRTMYQGHMAMITGIDRAFGWLMESLQSHGLDENTIVIFTSDHGDTLMSYDWPNNKGIAEAASCRVPLLIRWPGRLQPGVSDLLIGTFDLMPTILGMMDLPVPVTAQGRDASQSIYRGETDEVDALPLFFLPLNWRGVYTRRYTYSERLHAPDDPYFPEDWSHTLNVLYDRQADPQETRNLFDDPGHAAIREQLHRLTWKLMATFGDDGLDCESILRQTVRATDIEDVLEHPAKRPAGWEGRLQGPPVEVMYQLSKTWNTPH